MTKFYNLKVTDSYRKLENSINKFYGKSDLESKTGNFKEENTDSLEKSSSINLNDFKNSEAINPNYLPNNSMNNYSKKKNKFYGSLSLLI